ncbi:MAG: hypothetical protein ACI4TD_03930 [Phocaeicola sp.]
MIGAALIVPAPIGLITVSYNVASYQCNKQDQSLPQKNKRFLDNPDCRSEYVDYQKTRKPKYQDEQEHHW